MPSPSRHFRNLVRPALATAVGLATMAVLAVWLIIGKAAIEKFAWTHDMVGLAVGPEADPQAGVGPVPAGLPEDVAPFFLGVIGSLWLASGLTAALITIKRGGGFRMRMIAYLIFLAVLLPASYYNFTHERGDYALRAQYQAVLNIVLIFLGLSICSGVREWKAEAPDARVLKIMVFTLLLFSAVLIPGLLTMLWALWKIHVLSRSAVSNIGIPALTSFAGVVSAGVAVLKYLDDRKKAPDPPSPAAATRPLATATVPASNRRRRR